MQKKMSEIAIGVDPGVSGGIVLGRISEEKLDVLETYEMPKSFEGIGELLGGMLSDIDRPVSLAAIEDVPKFCGKNLSAATMSALFRNVGFCEGMLYFPGVTLTRLAPLKWMNTVSRDATRSRLRPERKAQLKCLANRMFPSHKWTDGTCDAVLILEAFRRIHYAQP